MPRDVRRLLLTAMALLGGVALFRRRPIKTPETAGDWHPADE